MIHPQKSEVQLFVGAQFYATTTRLVIVIYIMAWYASGLLPVFGRFHPIKKIKTRRLTSFIKRQTESLTHLSLLPYQPTKRTNRLFFFLYHTLAMVSFLVWMFVVDCIQAFAWQTATTTASSSFRRSSSSWLASSTSAADDLLYQEQEKMLVSRGELEGQLMANTKTPLQAHVVKGAGSKGGFGAKSSSSSSSSSSAALKTQAKELAKVLKQQGVVRMDNVLSRTVADDLRHFLFDLRAESETLVKQGKIKPIQRFADVLLRKNRVDMPVPLGPEIVTTALDEVLLQSPVGGVVQNLLTDQAVLYELSCLCSDPGSQRQVMHPDTPYNPQSDEPVLYTCFIALQDITIEMGPTIWMPNTHTLAIHEKFQDESIAQGATESPKDTLLRTQPAVLGTLPKGCCAVYDSRLLHCGGANQSDLRRALFYFSFRNPKISSVGNPGSIRRDMIGRWNLKSLQKELKLIRKGKPSGNFVSEP